MDITYNKEVGSKVSWQPLHEPRAESVHWSPPKMDLTKLNCDWAVTDNGDVEGHGGSA